MTFLEYMEKHFPEQVLDKYTGDVFGCPEYYNTDGRLVVPPCYPERTCTECWSRELPDDFAEMAVNE